MPAVQEANLLEDLQAQAHRQAYNAAFEELELNWSWDADLFAALRGPGPQAVRAYLEREQSHLLRAYEADFIVRAIEGTKERCYAAMLSHRAAAAARVPAYAAH